MAVFISQSELPTADEDPKSWNTIYIAGLECPGICLPIEGERRRSVDHRKAKGGSKDILTDNGLEPTEVTIRIRTTSGPQFRRLWDFYLKFMDPDRVLSRLAIVTVSHPQLYSRGIKQGYFFSAPLPKPTHDTGIYPYISEFRFKIVGPKTQISGGSSKPKLTNASAASLQGKNGVSNAVTALNSIVPILTGIGAGSLFSPEFSVVPPPSITPLLLFPGELKKLNDAGYKTAEFVNDQLELAAPLR